MSTEFTANRAELERLSDYSLQLSRWILKPIGVWPKSSYASVVERVVSLILNTICYCSILITVVPCILHLTFEDTDFRTKVKIFGPMTHWFVGGINYTTLLVRGEEIHHCVKQMQSDWRTVTRPEVQQVMLRDAKFGRNVATFCTVFMQGGVLCYCAAMAFTMDIVLVGNETRTVHMLPCAAYKKLIPVDSSPTNEIVLGVQFLSAFIVNSTAVGAYSLAIVFAAHAHGQLDVLIMWITEFVDQSSKNVRWDDLGVFVENHTNVLSFIAHIEHVMNLICFTELCQCTMAMCFLCYYILTEWEEHDVHNLTTYVIILISVTFNVFIMCYVGELLTKQCNRIAEVVYATNWYCLPCKNALDLTVIVTRSSTVTKITAGKIIYMSMYTFGDVIKTAFTYLNLLRQMT